MLITGMGIVCEKANFHSSETDSTEREKMAVGKRNLGGTKKKKGAPVLVLSMKHETYGVCAHITITVSAILVA